MKTVTLFLLTFILIISGCSKSNDFVSGNDNELQLKSADSRNMRFTFNPLGEDMLYIPVICDGVEVDRLIGDGTITAHGTAHWENGNPKWSRVIINGYLTSQETGEVFHVHEVDKMEFDENWQIIGDTHTAHMNIVGDRGTHFIASGVFYTLTDFVLEKAMCVPSSE